MRDQILHSYKLHGASPPRDPAGRSAGQEIPPVFTRRFITVVTGP